MSAEVRTPKAPHLRGDKPARRKWWRSARTRARLALKAGRDVPPPRHRHQEKWDRT